MAKETKKPFAKSEGSYTFARSESAPYRAAAVQVRADWQKEKLNMKHASGEISDKKYIEGLKGLVQDYRKGSGVRLGLKTELVGAAQQAAASYEAERTAELTKLRDEADIRWNEAVRDYSLGNITEEQFNQERQYHNEVLTGQAKVPGIKKLTQKALTGKMWNSYKSGRMRSLAREAAIQGYYKDTYGNKATKKEVRQLAKTEMSLPAIQQKLITDKGQVRDLEKEKQALNALVGELGRLPTHEEIRERAYGAV